MKACGQVGANAVGSGRGKTEGRPDLPAHGDQGPVEAGAGWERAEGALGRVWSQWPTRP